MEMHVFEEYESEVRSYCRHYTDVFDTAKGSLMVTESGKVFIDFLAGAGALNYGHNHDYIKQKIMDYIQSDAISHGLDMYTRAKRNFIEDFHEKILKPRSLEYKIQFTGPTGTNAVEAALKLARKVKNRTNIFSFMGGFHGMTLGSLSVTSNGGKRNGAGLPLNNVTFMPYPGGFQESFDTIAYMEWVLNDTHSGIDKPAAVIFETVQAEGGVNIAPVEWMRRLRDLCDRHDILMICDDIQVGCGRTGTFFSFERAGIVPDMVVLSKSISGYGLPMSIVLLKKELDIWQPGEHNGTFRGNQLAFVGASAALELREKERLDRVVKEKESYLDEFLRYEIGSLNSDIDIRGIGMIWAIDFSKFADKSIGDKVVSYCYEHGLIVETAGRRDTVIKLIPALTIPADELSKGCMILRDAIANCL